MSAHSTPAAGDSLPPRPDLPPAVKAVPAEGGGHAAEVVASGPDTADRVPSPFAGLGSALDRAASRGLRRVTGGALAPYQSAIVRIGFALAWLAYLVREFPHRDALYGPDSAWGPDLAKRILATNHAFTVTLWSDSRLWFELVYAVALLASASLLLGWRTRTSALLFMVGVLSLQNRSVFVGDGGDNVIHIMAIYLAFTRCGQVWSLDALAERRRERRRAAQESAARDSATRDSTEPDGTTAGSAAMDAPGLQPAGSDGGPVAQPETGAAARPQPAEGVDAVGIALWAVLGGALIAASFAGKLSTGWAAIFWACWLGQALWWAVRRYAPGEPRTVMAIMGDIVHNGAMLVIVAEVCLIYSTAGWYKIQGSHWQDGTALYYPLHLDDFTPWPALSHALAGNDVMVMLITYGTVIVQVAFPFTLFNRRVKNVLLCAMMLEHASIALVLGLPFFSLAMIAADAVFLPTGFLRWAGQQVVRAVRSPGRRGSDDDAAVPAQRGPASAAPAVNPPPPSTVG